MGTSKQSRWVMAGMVILFALACSYSGIAPVTQVVEVTEVVPVMEVVRVTRIVPVTRIVEVTRFVEEPSAVTEAPTEVPPPAPTEAPVVAATEQLVNEDVLVWYNFEGNFPASGIVKDRSGNGFDAQVLGSVDRTGGVIGQGISFFENGYLQTHANPAAGRERVSFSLWFLTDHPEYNYKLASAAWWNSGPGSGWIMATHAPEFWSDDTQSLYRPGMVNNDNGFAAGEWIHEVITYDGLRIKEYTNGELVNNWRVTGAALGTGEPMAIGAWPPFSAYNFQGSMDEFKILGWALSVQEVQDLYYQGE